MRRLAFELARLGCAVSLALSALALTRWGPVHAEPPLDVRALPVFPWLLGSALLTALLARRDPPPRAARPLSLALLACAALLAAVVAARGPVGLAALREGEPALLPGAIDLTPADLAGERGALVWDGPLRVPASGTYRIWVAGRGRVELLLDGRLALEAEAERLDAGAELPLGRGTHRLRLRYRPSGSPEARGAGIRGHRLRLGWIRPRADGSPGTRSDLVLPRYLGPPARAGLWPLVDALALALAGLLGLLAWFARWERPAERERPARPPRGELVLAAAGLAAVLVAMSWPLARDLAGHGVFDRADGRLNAWILAWGGHALAAQPRRVFDAPIFHPATDTLAFSENLLLPALLSAPALAAAGPALAYNLVFLASALLSGLGVHLLVRRGGGDGLGAFAAGALFAAGAHRWSRIAHLHAQLTLFLPFALFALDRFWERRSLRRSLELGLMLGLSALASIYLGVIAAAAVGLLLLAGLLAARIAAADLARLAAGGLLAAGLAAPVLLPYLQMRERYGAEWSLADVEPHGVTLPSYLAGGSALYAPLTERHLAPDLRRRPLFPGLVPLALGVAGLAAAPRRYRAGALVVSAAAVLISLGPETAVYRWLHEHVVVLRGVRAVNRFALLPVLALCVLAGFALARRRRLAAAALLAGLLEAADVPLRLAPYAWPSPAARWLAGAPGAVAVLPLGERDTEAMLDGLAHGRPLLNGYSGYTPPHYRWLADALEEPASEGALRLLRGLGVRHLVARAELPLPLAERFGDERIYAVPPGDAAGGTPAPGRARPALWQGGAVTVDLGEPRELSRLLFELGEAVPHAPPQLELSADGGRFVRAEARLDPAGAILGLAASPRRAFGALLLAEPARARFVRVRGLPARAGGELGIE